MAQSAMTLEEFTDTLTGFDEVAISKQFEGDIYDLLRHRPSMGMRAAIMVEQTRTRAATSWRRRGSRWV